MQNWDSNTKNPIIPNFALCSPDLSYIWVQNLVTQINLTENLIFCEVEDLQRVPLESVVSNSPQKSEVEYPFYGTRSSQKKFNFEGSHYL